MSKTVYLDSPQSSEGKEILAAILSTAGLDPDWCDDHFPISAIVINGKEDALDELRNLMLVGVLLTEIHRNPTVKASHVKKLLEIGDHNNFGASMAQITRWQKQGYESWEIDGFLDCMVNFQKQ